MTDGRRSALAPSCSKRICQPHSEAGNYGFHFAPAVFIVAIVLAVLTPRGEAARALREEA